ncbi:MAG: amidohydrolase [Deltaproteobacteria bacterium]|nr:amidohydrolase [Deltaproteobacteria bacterium]
MLLIKNGLIHDMVSPKAYEGDILVDGGKIAAIGKNLDAPEDVWAIDADGKEVYPGFVDAHSHLGLDIYGIGYEGNDYNEMTDVCCPQLRGIDSFNPFDKAIEMALSGGVTTVGTGPGSANVLGGTFFAVKTKGVRVDDMVVKNPVAMKCAFGENPKRCYREKSVSARMTVAAKLREMLFKTREYLDKKEAAGDDVAKRPAFDMRLEALIPVIKGELPLKAHAHQANDILTAIRIAKEFGVKLTLEHCTEGHLIADELAQEGYPCAVGPTLTHASKWELQNKSWITPGVLSGKGLQVSIITDAPVIPQQHLVLCASLAAQAGMDPYEAMKAITINPAKHLGIDARVGSLEAGKDADILLFDRTPLLAPAVPRLVVLNGEVAAGNL